MKKILLAVCFVASIVVFASCKKETPIDLENFDCKSAASFAGYFDTEAECSSACDGNYCMTNGWCGCL